ncbi:MAG: hypothetical protein JXR77_06050 [Lentisphaeria bacterium]|nr:hypothetical protein [Lentisphaeria bacterium]
MGKLGTFFGIIAAVLAIAAAALSFLISQKRALYEERAGKLAGTVAGMVQKMDQNSNTGLAATITFTAADKTAGTAEDGALAWTKYAEDSSAFDGLLTQALTLSGNLNQQRDDLADALGKTAASMQMADTDLDPAMLRNLGDPEEFGRAVNGVLGHAEAVSARDQAMLKALIRASDDISHPIDQMAFSRRDETTDVDGNVVKGQFPCAVPLDEFGGHVKGMVTRCNQYADTMAEAINRVTKHQWEADPSKIRDEREYAGVLTSLLNDFDDINEQLALYEQAKKELAEQKQRIAQLMDEVEDTRGELKDTQKELSRVKRRLGQYERTVGGSGGDGEGTLDPNMVGEVLDVNPEWDFVIVNKGRQDHVSENLRLLVARGDKLVAKLMVSKVLGKVSVAEILPEALVTDVKVGDRVIVPRQQ